MCEQSKIRKILVKIPADLSSTGQEKWKYAQIDSCIAPLVKGLQNGGIDMRGSCCGHGKTFGDIHLQDGRVLVIMQASLYFDDIFQRTMTAMYKQYVVEGVELSCPEELTIPM